MKKEEFTGFVSKLRGQLGLRPTEDGENPIGRAKRDIKAGETISVYMTGSIWLSDDIEFFNPIGHSDGPEDE